jgi:Ca-activated chloride channel family protein
MDDKSMRAVWMRRVQSDPAEFLRARFAYQLHRERQPEEADAPADR